MQTKKFALTFCLMAAPVGASAYTMQACHPGPIARQAIARDNEWYLGGNRDLVIPNDTSRKSEDEFNTAAYLAERVLYDIQHFNSPDVEWSFTDRVRGVIDGLTLEAANAGLGNGWFSPSFRISRFDSQEVASAKLRLMRALKLMPDYRPYFYADIMYALNTETDSAYAINAVTTKFLGRLKENAQRVVFERNYHEEYRQLVSQQTYGAPYNYYSAAKSFFEECTGVGGSLDH